VPGKIIVSRDNPKDIGFREAVIFIDGNQAAVLRPKKSAELDVAPGKHQIQASNRMLKSPVLDFEIAEGETISFSTGNVAGGCFMLFMILQMAAPRIVLERRP